MIYNSNTIQEILPHRAPFLLIDGITAIEPGKSATGIKTLSINDPVFQGHFPDEHIYPGVLLVEAMAQVGAVALLSEEENRGKKAYFARIKEMKFQSPARPGDTIILECTLTARKGRIGYASCKSSVGERIVCKGEIAFALES